jgi:hypothetical protein
MLKFLVADRQFGPTSKCHVTLKGSQRSTGDVSDVIVPPCGTNRRTVTEDLNERRIAVEFETRPLHGDRKQNPNFCVQGSPRRGRKNRNFVYKVHSTRFKLGLWWRPTGKDITEIQAGQRHETAVPETLPTVGEALEQIFKTAVYNSDT